MNCRIGTTWRYHLANPRHRIYTTRMIVNQQLGEMIMAEVPVFVYWANTREMGVTLDGSYTWGEVHPRIREFVRQMNRGKDSN